MHTGMLFPNPGAPILLDLATHMRVRSALAGPEYGWTTPRLSVFEQGTIGTISRKVALEYVSNGLPYSIQLLAKFTRDGIAVLGELGGGFTCATFVLAIFEAGDIALLDSKTWIIDQVDLDYQKWLLDEFLPSQGATPDFISEQRKNPGSYRFRPEDVAAAASLWDGSAKRFGEVRPLAENLVSQAKADLPRLG